MTGTITYILSSAGYRAMNGPLADERRRLVGAEPPAAYVSYDPRLLAGAGWYGYRIALKGGDRQMVERARYMLSERYVIRDGYEYYAGGVYVFGVLLRERVPHYGIGGGAPTPEPEALNFYMPNGGTISLNKTGSPTVVELEYRLDANAQWLIWQPDVDGNRSITLTAGQTVYIRNTSETVTGFSIGSESFWRFSFDSDVYASGSVMSLVIDNANCYTLPTYCFYSLFKYCKSLLTAPELPARTASARCYRQMFYGCTSLIVAPELHIQTLYARSCDQMFYGCTSLNEIHTVMTDISAADCLNNWLDGVAATGDFYCPAELTIPTGSSGIPSGWTRHDI